MRTYFGFTLQQWAFAIILLLLAAQTALAPASDEALIPYIGGKLLLAAVLVFIQAFQRQLPEDRKSGRYTALSALLIGFLLVNYKLFQSGAVLLFIALVFAGEGLQMIRLGLIARRNGRAWMRYALAVLGNLLLLLAIFLLRGRGFQWIASIAMALRLAGMAIEVLSSKPGEAGDVTEDLLTESGLNVSPQTRQKVEQLVQEENDRAPIDIRWIFTFLIILFAIHLGRMGYDRSSTGLLSPMVALIGDMVIALIIGWLVLAPLAGAFRSSTHWLMQRSYNWVSRVPKAQRNWYSLRNPVQWWLESRMRDSISFKKASYSLPTAIRVGLKKGLPFAALLAAIVPVFGMSWYFDTENWAAGIWDSWAAARTDRWRSAMAQAVDPAIAAGSFTITPDGVSDTADFSFIIVGDPGEGDASQLILHNQLLRVSEKPDVKFVVVSSDVIYPDGAIKDYEKNFWLPMHGIRKPVMAIPGNHDWYDGCDAFAATFFTPEAAQKAIEARRGSDLEITAAIKEKTATLLQRSNTLRNLYHVPTGFQTATYFQIQTPEFAFITIETGVLRRIDDKQMQWLTATLEASKNKFIFVLLGHPLYAIGEYQGDMNEDFTALHNLLRQYNVKIAMAGDTHDLEHYVEPQTNKQQTMHHFVNGGGGAYLSIGAALKPDSLMPQKMWARYPSKEALINKIETHTGWLKQPAWKWTKNYNGWPFSAEWLSAAFDYNVAPFFQSFVEVKVSKNNNEVSIIPYSADGPLLWGEIDHASGYRPAGLADADPVVWRYTLRAP